MKTNQLVIGLALAAATCACGDNIKAVDAQVPQMDTTPMVDAPNFPAAPALGVQIDRMGRPAVNTALVGAFLDVSADAQMKKDAYNQASNPTTWLTTMLATGRSVRDEFAVNLAVVDVLDQGVFDGCMNQVLYNGIAGGGGTPAAVSYLMLASILADDMLYADTSKTVCPFYLAVEFGVATGGSINTCGGRAPTTDVVDFSYSALAAGLDGFNLSTFTPLVGDGVGPHSDVSDTVFPFFGLPAAGT